MKKTLKVLSTAALLASVAAPFAAPVNAASASITALQTPTVKEDTTAQSLGMIKVVVPAGTLKANDSILVKLPSGVDFGSAFNTSVGVDPTGADNRVFVPAQLNGEANSLAGVDANTDGDYDDGGDTASNLTVSALSSDEIKITAPAAQGTATDGVFYIQLNDVDLDNPTSGPIEVNFDAAGNTGFPAGKVTVGSVYSSGQVSLSVSGTDESNDSFNFDLRIKEAVAGSLKRENETLKLRLPSGYEWDTTSASNVALNPITGETAIVDYQVNGDKLTIDFKGIDGNADGDALDVGEDRATNTPSYWEIAGLAFSVEDEGKVKDGDINMTVSGKTSTNISEVKVGTYGEFGAKVTAKSTPNVVAGREEQEIGDINIKEAIGESLTNGRTVTFTLPAGARWQGALDNVDLDEDTDEGVTLNFVGFTGTNNRTAKYTISNPSGGDDAADLTLEDLEVALEAGFEGDLEVEVGGNAGLTGKVVVAKASTPVSASVSEAKDVKIGLSNQAAGDLVITEKVAGALQDDNGANTVVLDLPAGVVFTSTPKVEVTEGDLRIENVRRTNGDNSISFDIDSESTKPSTIKVSGMTLKLDRTVAEGDVTLKVQGAAAVETSGVTGWENSDTAAKAVIAKVTTPAPTDTTASNIVFKLNSKTFTVDGKEITMDAAPLVAWDRAFLPVRFAANALNVSDDNIIWDDKTSTATIFKGDRVITAKVGDKFLTVNGAKVPMDVPVYRSAATNNRVMIPVRYLSNALGADIQWNQETSEITIKAAK